MQKLRVALGALLWVAMLLGCWFWAARWKEGALGKELAPQLWRYASGERHEVPLRLSGSIPLAVGDPIFTIEQQQVKQVGEVTAAGARGRVLLYSSAPPLHDGSELLFHQTPDSMDWVMATMLPAEKRDQIAREISAAFAQHHEEILQAMKPVVEASLREAMLVVEEELPAALDRHRPELQKLGAKYQRDIVEREIVPLVRQEIWPIVQRRARPAAEQVGHDIWRRASLWRFGWRLAYDRLPLTENRMVRGEWNRFIAEEALPVLDDYTDDFIRIQQAILVDAVRNELVRRVFRESMVQMLDDPQLQEIAWQILRELVVDNPRLREVFHRHWTGPAAQQALQVAAQRLQPTVERIGELLFGSPEGGITPEFARVLRNHILGKDQRWLILHSGVSSRSSDEPLSPSVLNVRRGSTTNINPFARLP